MQARLQTKVEFLAEDAPAVAYQLNAAKKQVRVEDIRRRLAAEPGSFAISATPLMTSGIGLVNAPVLLLLDTGKGRILLSQLLTSGRLNRSNLDPGLYECAYDPAADQLVLNMFDLLLGGEPPAAPGNTKQASRLSHLEK